MSPHPTVFLTAGGDPVKPLRVLKTEAEWSIFLEMREHAKKMDYAQWKEWAKGNIVYAYSCKVAKQLGLQTPGKQVPSPLFHARLRHSTREGELKLPEAELQVEYTGKTSGRATMPGVNNTSIPRHQ